MRKEDRERIARLASERDRRRAELEKTEQLEKENNEFIGLKTAR